MTEKINIAELLKDCPKGMELYSPIFGELKFAEVNTINNRILVVQQNDYIAEFESDGRLINCKNGECLLFPSKGKTTWEGFVPPYSFNDGDIVATTNGLFVGIVEVKNNKPVGAYCSVDYVKYFRINSDYVFDRLATTWEKEKLFQTIKDNGYRWNPETKTLGRLTPNKFDTTTLKPFDKVLVRDDVGHRWRAGFYRVGCASNYTIPYEGNEHLLGTTNECDEYFKTW